MGVENKKLGRYRLLIGNLGESNGHTYAHVDRVVLIKEDFCGELMEIDPNMNWYSHYQWARFRMRIVMIKDLKN